MSDDRGQVSIEALAASVILIATLLFVLLQVNQQGLEIDFAESAGLQRNDCLRLQNAISLVDSGSGNSEIKTEIGFDANISGSYINFEDYYCELVGVSVVAQLERGVVVVKKEGGIVSAQNA